MSTPADPNAAATVISPDDAAALSAALDSARKVDFDLGHVYMTPGIKYALDNNYLDSAFVRGCLEKHERGEWGDVSDPELNEQALTDGSRIFSVYRTADVDDGSIWIITDATSETGQREATTILLPSEY